MGRWQPAQRKDLPIALTAISDVSETPRTARDHRYLRRPLVTAFGAGRVGDLDLDHERTLHGHDHAVKENRPSESNGVL